MAELASVALIAVAPTLGIASSPGWRKMAVAIAGLASAAAWVFMVSRTNPTLDWLPLGIWSGIGLLFAGFRPGLDEGRVELLEKERAELSRRAHEYRERLSDTKALGKKSDEEQKKAQAVYGVVKTLSEATNLSSIKPKVASAIQEYLGLEQFALFIAGIEESDRMEPLVNRLMENSVAASWSTLKSYLEENGVDADHAHLFQGSQNALGIPIFQGTDKVGYLFAMVPRGADPDKTLVDAQEFTGEISFALKRVSLFNEVERLSEIDGLTGVYRRSVLDEKIEAETKRSSMFKTSFCFMLLDIDHFKSINDNYGHPFGDAVLKRVGEILQSSVYETDFVARYGGEEFAIVLPRADAIGVLTKAEAIRARIEQETFVQGLETVKVTVSIGVAHFPRDGKTGSEVVEAADKALYAAKETGRNRIVDAS